MVLHPSLSQSILLKLEDIIALIKYLADQKESKYDLVNGDGLVISMLVWRRKDLVPVPVLMNT